MDYIKILLLILSFLKNHPDFQKKIEEPLDVFKDFIEETAKELGATIEEIYQHSGLQEKFVEKFKDWWDESNNKLTHSEKELYKEIKEIFCLADWMEVIRFYQQTGMYREAEFLVNFFDDYIQNTNNKSEVDVIFCLECAFIKSLIGEKNKAFEIVDLALSIAQELPRENDNIIVEVYLCLNIICQINCDIQTATQKLEEALKLEKPISKDRRLKLLNNLMMGYLIQNTKYSKYRERVKNLFEESNRLRDEMFEEEFESCETKICYLAIKGYLEIYDGKYAKAIEYLNEAIAISIKCSEDNIRNFAALLEILGYAYIKIGHEQEDKDKFKSYEEARKNLQKSFDLNKKLIGIENIYSVRTLGHMAELHFLKHEWYTAREKSEDAMNIAKKLEDKYSNDAKYSSALCEVKNLISMILIFQLKLMGEGYY